MLVLDAGSTCWFCMQHEHAAPACGMQRNGAPARAIRSPTSGVPLHVEREVSAPCQTLTVGGDRMSYTNPPDDGTQGEMPSRSSTPQSRWRRFDRRRAGVAVIAFAAVASIGIVASARTTRASDHQDTPEVELNPRMDINDLYAFPGSSADRTTSVLTPP